jgi:phosphoglycerate dehydrogenase-like enzyme
MERSGAWFAIERFQDRTTRRGNQDVEMHGRKIAVIGLGYVGLPVAVAWGRAGVPTVGPDVNGARIAELQAGREEARSPNQAGGGGASAHVRRWWKAY